MTGNFSTPSFSIARRRMTPVVVSSMLPMTSVDAARCARRASSFLAQSRTCGMHVVEPVEGDEDHGRDEVGAVVHRDVRLDAPGRRRCACSRCRCPRRGWRRRRCRSPAPGWRRRRPGCESGLDAISTRSAPPAWSVRARLAVSAVTCRQADMRRPLSGFSFAKRSRMRASTGMSLVGPEDAFLALRGKLDVGNIRLLRNGHEQSFL